MWEHHCQANFFNLMRFGIPIDTVINMLKKNYGSTLVACERNAGVKANPIFCAALKFTVK